MKLDDYHTSAHATWSCKYHLVFCPKYRGRILHGEVGRLARDMIRQQCQWNGVEVLGGHVSRDHVHMLLEIPPKLAVSKLVGLVKGKTAIRMFERMPALRRRLPVGC